jgi:DNA processing protein
MTNDLLYKIALSLIPGIGHIRAKRLVAYCGSVEAVFREKRAMLEKVPGIGQKYASVITRQNVFERAEQEIRFLEKNKIRALFYLDKDYPKRLTHCEDSPALLYFKGDTDLNTQKAISIVGTRLASDYGRDLCESWCVTSLG